MSENEFSHEEWVKTMVDNGLMAEPGEDTYTPGQEGENVAQPDLNDSAQAAEEAAKAELEGNLANTEGGVEVKYLGHGAYEAEGVEVKRNGQTVTVDENKAQSLVGLQDADGNALFERV